MLPFAQDLDGDKIHVQAPTDVIFLCGGETSDIGAKPPLSLRDAFLKILDNPPLKGRQLIQAEEITSGLKFFSRYGNVLEFERDLAQIVELIILFSESPGSFAELGAFSSVEEIAERLFVIIRDKHWDDQSFITLGPLEYLTKQFGRKTVFVIADATIGMKGNSAEFVNLDTLKVQLAKPLTERLDTPRDPSTFDPSRPGHLIKLIVGLIQEYGALEDQELLQLLPLFNVTSIVGPELDRYLLCAEAVTWIKKISKGTADYLVAVATKQDAATFFSKATATEKDKARRRMLIREHWKKTDEQRFSAITDVLRGIAK